MPNDVSRTAPRKRMTREERYAQLLQVAWQLIAEEGTDALSLGRLAEAAGITKPTVYEHFGTRHGLLAALYQDYENRQNAIIDQAMAAGAATLEGKARAIAASYIACVLSEGREIPEVLAALSGSSELAELRKQCQRSYIDKCRQVLAPFTGTPGLGLATLWALLGAADSLALVAVEGEISEAQAVEELYRLIIDMVRRTQ
ncbi:TetR/AcrR family transcriptional regulator [uncultured Pseudomonas sp.]|uniref:TetR/AcrR family transcriptional regulator n=1 Tax=uncultured Pseudomonas sp. TaxID=114707 RepID=UPI0025DFDC1B|nr:TetR/AcrR family transcriptional regulator [uncultured Pseudomonas sp.]